MMTDFKNLLFRAGFMNFGKLNRKQVCEFLMVKERTLERWISKNKPCPRAVRLLEMRINGSVSNDKAWDGFFICRDGYLWTPRGARYEPDYINKIDILQRTSRYHEAQTASLQAEIDYLKELVVARDKLKEMGRDLIEMSDRFRFKDAMLRFEQQKKDKSA
ncbi:hypothetical protein [Pseudoalteromonas piscicida]|uniref:Uncharacterized protein n=1 Tax=Pseudoalteromonas piscicida TaxID=43662 RepID=A0AAD0RGF4_PSEO7|nr:hypothetical protein [Pseudoalteromonas piscicida]ASD67026.1 hypothetical protein B1L02_08315 [Pseudoalteromonas piscicida]AXR02267.1 hypothetical protein D0511_09455 [Pseudoalteromonas piscicida]